MRSDSLRFWTSFLPAKQLSSPEEREMEYINDDLLRKVVYFEWVLIVICTLGEYAVMTIAPSDARVSNEAPDLRTSLIFLFIVFMLSFVNPRRSTYWDRMCFLFLEIVTITGSAAAGIWQFVAPIYMVSLAKACLILDRPGQLIIFIAALITQILNGCFKFYITTDWVQHAPFALSSIFSMLGSSLVKNYSALSMMVLVGILTLTLVSEQKARQEAERLSKEVQNLATELERTRIAQEIHDSLGHTLTSLNIQLEVARKFAERDQKRAADALDLAKQLAGQSLTDVRTAIQSIRHPDFDLKEAVNSLAKQIKQSQPLDVIVEIQAVEIPAAIGYQLFRIIQECLTNVMKHAEASQVNVKLTQAGKRIELHVTDNGKGISAQGQSQGFGIRGMQERVESMHGTVEIQSQPGEGTSLQVVIPI